MGGNDKRKLEAEELENRVAPMALVYTEPTNQDPTAPGTGTGDPGTQPAADQPGKSDGRRQNEFKQQV